MVQALARELFNEARDRYDTRIQEEEAAEKRKKEGDRAFVAPRLVDRPMADALALFGDAGGGADADDNWFYVSTPDSEMRGKIIEQLYSDRTQCYAYSALGRTERLAKFEPQEAKFVLNEDHEFIMAFASDPGARRLLETVATSEVMLEVYLREAGVAPYVVGDLLERRDILLRSLAQDQVYSLEAIAKKLDSSIDDQYELEIALVAAARALGFNAKHVSGAGEPDGIARYADTVLRETKITLEAKSSMDVPQLAALDFAGLREHVTRHEAKGCLLVAPAYPGQVRSDNAVAHRAQSNRISCWLVTDLARVVRLAEANQITAEQVAQIGLDKHAPVDVQEAINSLLGRPNLQKLYCAVLNALRDMNVRRQLVGSPRKVGHVAVQIVQRPEFADLEEKQIRKALVDIANASRGAMLIKEDVIVLTCDIDEVRRRVASLTGELAPPRRTGKFRADEEA